MWCLIWIRRAGEVSGEADKGGSWHTSDIVQAGEHTVRSTEPVSPQHPHIVQSHETSQSNSLAADQTYGEGQSVVIRVRLTHDTSHTFPSRTTRQ